MEIKDRIKTIMEREDMTPGVFAESIGLNQSTFSHVLSGRNKPSLDVVMKVHQKYSNISLNWLLYGDGDMIEDNTTGASFQTSLFDENSIYSSDMTGSNENHKEMSVRSSEKSANHPVAQEIKYIERPHRKITEIRIFFDDNTYEIFKGEK